jgi:hypothetical protein
MSEPNILESGMRERIGRRNSDLVGTMHVSKVCPSCSSTCVNPTKQPPSHQSCPMSPTDHIEKPGLGCLGWALVGAGTPGCDFASFDPRTPFSAGGSGSDTSCMSRV